MKEATKLKIESISPIPEKIPEEITDQDLADFETIISTELDDQQVARILHPPATYPRQEIVLAVHWHPEFIPFDLITRRIDTMFPNRKRDLIIPTQHNEILSYNGYSGVEVDCYSSGFNQKVQLLLHFENSRLENAGVLKGMLDHTFKYRSSQLFRFIHAIVSPDEEKLSLAARETGADPALIEFVRAYVKKIGKMLDQKGSDISPHMVKNKLLRNFFDELRSRHGDVIIERAQTFLTAVKKLVKADFSLEYFYRTSEIIEEARYLNAGIVIPHPEQFWPILLADYDVDGYEVWNPQSQRYTNFLIYVVNQKNRHRRSSEERLLIFMGDDTHMGEKIRDPRQQNVEKAGREIGVQPAWDDLNIRKSFIMADCSREKVIKAYKERLAG